MSNTKMDYRTAILTQEVSFKREAFGYFDSGTGYFKI